MHVFWCLFCIGLRKWWHKTANRDGPGIETQTGYYYRARYYDPVLKRFISEDPIGIESGLNVYAYVVGNPLGFNDPTGEVPVVVAAAAVGAVIGGISGGLSAFNSGASAGTVIASIGLGALSGAASTASIGTKAVASISTVLIGGIAGGAGNLIGQIAGGASCINWQQVKAQAAVGALAGLAASPLFVTPGIPASQLPATAAAVSGIFSFGINAGVPTSKGGFNK